ncbi:MAG TPA: hypothetical protein VG407_11535 [Caulobacteraceae bacterium]|jgi:hypothetical protein|nr:hypothetical protein [Caulobacteraceae bacterium]
MLRTHRVLASLVLGLCAWLAVTPAQAAVDPRTFQWLTAVVPRLGFLVAIIWLIMALAIAELIYSRPKGWYWWILSIFFIPPLALISLAQSGKSIAYRRQVNRMKAEAAKQTASKSAT